MTRQGLCARTALQPVMAGDRQAGQTLFHLLRVFKERQQRRVGRDPLVYLEASASSSLAATPPFAFTRNGKGSQILETDQRTLQSKISRQSDSLKIQTPLPVQAEAQIQAL